MFKVTRLICRIKIQDANLPEHILETIWFGFLSFQLRILQATKFNHLLDSTEI